MDGVCHVAKMTLTQRESITREPALNVIVYCGCDTCALTTLARARYVQIKGGQSGGLGQDTTDPLEPYQTSSHCFRKVEHHSTFLRWVLGL